jgi:hypothetical protein
MATAIRVLRPISGTTFSYKPGDVLTLADDQLATDWCASGVAQLYTEMGTATAASLYNAHTILAATADDTPAALTVGEQTVVGRITGGNIAALTVAQMQALLVPVANAQTAGYTLVLGDAGKLVEVSSGTAVTLTVPTNATVAFPVGTRVEVLQTGAGQVTVAAAGGVTVNAKTGLKVSAQWGRVILIKRATDTWALVGDTAA